MDAERWMTQETILIFLNKINEVAKKEQKNVTFYLFGGCAMCLHGVRNSTNDFDSMTYVDGEVSKDFVYKYKDTLLSSIGIDKSHCYYETTYNDVANLENKNIKQAEDFIKYTEKKFTFNKTKIGSNVTVKIPSLDYLLINRLIDMTYEGAKQNLDKIDCEKIAQKLQINSENKHEFLEKISEHKKYELIEQSLNTVLEKLEKNKTFGATIKSIRTNAILESNKAIERPLIK